MFSLSKFQRISFQSIILDDINDHLLFILCEIIYSFIKNLKVFIFIR